MEFKDKNIIVVGMAKSGIGSANLLLRLGANVTLVDKKGQAELTDFTNQLEKGVKTSLGGYDLTELKSVDMIVISPGVALKEIEKMVGSNIEIIGELELAYRVLNMLESPPPILAITGTNGKTTATTLLGEIIKRDRKKSWDDSQNCRVTPKILVAGNIGNAITTELLKLKIDEQIVGADFSVCPKSEPSPLLLDMILLEVSSFQLETVSRFRPFGSAILNITPDHLDRYRDIMDYAETKYRIFLNQKVARGLGANSPQQTNDSQKQDFLVLNADCPLTFKIAEKIEKTGPEVYYFSINKEVTGAYCTNGKIHFNLPSHRIKTNKEGVEFDDLGLTIDTKEILLKGSHNIENIMAVSLMALLSGCSFESIKETLKGFSGLHHRIEYVGEIDGVSYYDDSKATNVDAVVRALETFTQPIILIAGGRDKDGDFRELIIPIEKKVKALILIGEASGKINSVINKPHITYMEDTMKDAVLRAKKIAVTGDIVLLSPACASFDMFKDYKERGMCFSEEVRRFIQGNDTK